MLCTGYLNMTQYKHVVNGKDIQIVPLSDEELLQMDLDEQNFLSDKDREIVLNQEKQDRITSLANKLRITEEEIKFLLNSGS